MRPDRRTCIQLLIGLAMPGAMARAQPSVHAGRVDDETWFDTERRREIPVRLRWPDMGLQGTEYPVILFSHGLGGTRDGGAVWGDAWSKSGFLVIHIQHSGSDLNAVKLVTNSFENRQALRSVANASQLVARLGDVRFVLDEIHRRKVGRLERWGNVRASRVGMSGHSFGAHTTLGMAGQRYPNGAPIIEPRLTSFIAFSPTAPVAPDATVSFAMLDRPMLTITGTLDDDVTGVGATPERRAAVFAALPPGNKAQLVLKGADHMTFAGQTGQAADVIRRESTARNLQSAHHVQLASVTTDWWRATLMDDSLAAARLAAPAALAVGDLWQRK